MNARIPSRALLLGAIPELIQKAGSSVLLSEEECLQVLYSLNANCNFRSFTSHAQDLFLDLIAELEPEEQPEMSSYRTLEPATLDRRIEP